MAETHRSHWSALRMGLSSALLLGALTVLGVAALPQQSAHAAPKPKSVACQGEGDSLFCDGQIYSGNGVVAKATLKNGDYCIYVMSAKIVGQLLNPDGSFVSGEVTGKVLGTKSHASRGEPDPCEVLDA